ERAAQVAKSSRPSRDNDKPTITRHRQATLTSPQGSRSSLTAFRRSPSTGRMALVMIMSPVEQETRRVCNLPCPADATCLGLQKQSARLLLEQMCDWLLHPIIIAPRTDCLAT